MRKSVFRVLCLVVFAMPWESAFQLPGLGTLSRVAGLVAITLALLDVAYRGAVRRPCSLFGLLVLLTLYAGSSALWSRHQDATLVGILSYLQFLGLAWLVSEYVQGESHVFSLLYAYVLGSLVGSIAVWLNFLQGRSFTASRYGAFDISPNNLGLIMALSIPIALFLGFRPDAPFRRLIMSTIPLTVSAVLLTGSRTAALASIGGMFLFLAGAPLGTRRRVMLAVLTVVLIGSAMFVIPENTVLRLLSVSTEITSGDWNARKEIWEAAAIVFHDSPVFGVGLGGSPHAISRLLGSSVSTHNMYLAFLVELGIIGLCIVLAIWIQVLYQVLRIKAIDFRIMWISMLAILLVGSSLLGGWEQRKHLWFLWAFAAVSARVSVDMGQVSGGYSRSGHGSEVYHEKRIK